MHSCLARMSQLSLVLALLPVTSARAADPPGPTSPAISCLERLRSAVRRDVPVEVVNRQGDVTQGLFVRVASDPDRLDLKFFDSSASRMTIREIPFEEIALIRGHEEKTSLKLPIGCGFLLGSIGFLLGQEIAKDPDYGTRESRRVAAALLPSAGVALGFGIGAVLTPRETWDWQVNCPEISE